MSGMTVYSVLLFSGDLVLSLPTTGGSWGSAATRGRTRNRQKGTYDEFIKKISMSTIAIPNLLTSLSIARRNTFNTTFGLNLEIWPFPKLYFSSINALQCLTFHIWSKLGHFTCWGKNSAFFLKYHQKIFNLRNIWLWINLMRWRYDACALWPGLSVRTRTRFKFPVMQSISVISFATQITVM